MSDTKCRAYTFKDDPPFPDIPVVCFLDPDHPGKHWDRELGIEFDSDEYGKPTKLDIQF
jgi:hypothetical protein